MAKPLKAALVHLGRAQARGEVRRVASWRAVLEGAGANVLDVALAPGRMPHLDGLVDVARGEAVPESLTWSTTKVMERLESVAPDIVIVVSTRAFDRRITSGPWTTVLDYVDSLARSYADRGEVVGGVRRFGFATLARAHDRAEQRLSRGDVRTVAAGWADAQRLEADWVPIVVEPTAPVDATPDHDVLFVGTLRYPPNVDALEQLATMWPRVLRSRPATSALIAGADPTARVLDLAARHGWEVAANFSSLPQLAARARLAVAPLQRTAGIQIKVLDAATVGLPQVVTTPALAGLAPGFPLVPVDDDNAFADEILRLLDDTAAAQAVAAGVRTYVDDEYGVARWAGWVRKLG